MKKKSIKSLALNKEVISRFNSMSIQGGKALPKRTTPGNGCDTAQSFCEGATCGVDCEVQTASEQTVCCN
ncbi:hypothetical protein [Dokdonia pacifica]|nr:hypothetical protein [Dokdonia pacifica]